jgi:hypothetical protein
VQGSEFGAVAVDIADGKQHPASRCRPSSFDPLRMRKVHVPSSFRIGLSRRSADQAPDGLRKRRSHIPVFNARLESAFSA